MTKMAVYSLSIVQMTVYSLSIVQMTVYSLSIVQMKKIQDVMLKACAENEAIWRNIWKGGI